MIVVHVVPLRPFQDSHAVCAVKESGSVTPLGQQSSVKMVIQASTHVVHAVHWKGLPESHVVIVATGSLNAVLMVSPSTAAALLQPMNAMDVVSWKQHLADSAANAMKASGPVI
jgi:hypothetical protein